MFGRRREVEQLLFGAHGAKEQVCDTVAAMKRRRQVELLRALLLACATRLCKLATCQQLKQLLEGSLKRGGNAGIIHPRWR
jgi:hypothetical protein